MRLHVLIVCSHFPPLNMTGARRPYHLARKLTDLGHQVTVLTDDAASKDRWQTDLTGIRVIRSPLVRYPQSLGLFGRLILDLYHAAGTSLTKRLTRLIIDLLLPLNSINRSDPDITLLQQRIPIPDIVLATGPKWSTFEIGDRLRERWKTILLVDYRDPWSVAIPEVGIRLLTWHGRGLVGWLKLRRTKRLERRFTRRATGITAATPLVLENALRIIGTRPSMTIYNGGSAPAQHPRVHRNGSFQIVYTGATYHEQEWGLFISALRRLRAEHTSIAKEVNVILIGARGIEQHLKDASDVRSMITLNDRMDRDAIQSIQMNADLLLHVGFKDKKGILPLKFMEYLHTTVPILQVSSGNDLQESIVQRTGAGWIARSEQDVLSVILDRHSLWRSGDSGLHERAPALAEFTWDHQMQRWVDFIQTIYKSARSNGS